MYNKNFYIKFLLLLSTFFISINLSAQCPAAGSVTSSATATNASCADNGTIKVNYNSATNLSLQLIQNGNIIEQVNAAGTSYTFTNLQGDNYVVKVICSNNNSIVYNTINITVPTTYTPISNANISVTASCSGGAGSGIIKVNSVTGGSAPYQYKFVQDPSINFPDTLGTYSTNNTKTGAAFGTWQVRVIDACNNYRTFTVQVNNPYPAIGFEFSSTRDNCTNGRLGVMTYSNYSQADLVAMGGFSLKIYEANATGTAPIGAPLYQNATYTGQNFNFNMVASHKYWVETVSPCGTVWTNYYEKSWDEGDFQYWVDTSNSGCGTPGNPETMRLWGGVNNLNWKYPVTVTIKNSSNTTVYTKSLTLSDLYFDQSNFPFDNYTITFVDGCGNTKTQTVTNANLNGTPGLSVNSYPQSGLCPQWNTPGTSQVILHLDGYIVDQTNAVVTIISGPSNVGVAGTHIWNNNFISWTNMLDGTYTVQIASCGQIKNATFTVSSPPGLKLQVGLTSAAQNSCNGNANIINNISYNGGDHLDIELYDINNNLVATSSGNFYAVANGKYHTKMKVTGCGTSYYVDGNDVIAASGGAMKISYAIGVVCEDSSGNPLTTGTAYVNLSGVAPYTLNYKIKGTSTWTTITNANQNNVIPNLQAGAIYDLQFLDSCGASYNSSVKIRTIAKIGLVTNSNPCYNQPFTIEAQQYQGATYEWRKGSASGPIVSSTYKKDFANYTTADDGVYVCIISWGTCASRYLTITLDGSKCGQALFTPIVAAPDINQTPVNVAVGGNVKTNDSGDNITVISAEQNGTTIAIGGTPTQVSGVDVNGNPVANAGTITLKADGTYVFTPANGFVGTVNTITYNIKSSQGFVESTTLDITVIPLINPVLNSNPIANNDTATTEVNTNVSSTVLNNDKDPNGDALTVTGANQGGSPLTIGTATTVSGVDVNGNTIANAGTVTLNSNGTYTYIPATGFVGTVDPIAYTISDGSGGTDIANLYINVTPNSGNQTFANDDANLAPKGVTMVGDVLFNDLDPEGNPTTVTGATVTHVKGNAITPIVVTPGTATTIPGAGVLTINSNGTYTFVPAAGFVGTIVVPYTKCDIGVTPQACDTATLYLTSLDNGPQVSPDINQTPVNVPVSANVLTNDNGNGLAVSGATQGATTIAIGTPTQVAGVDLAGNAVANAGTITLNSNGTYIYTPATGFVGNVNQIIYTVKDSNAVTVSTTLDITVIPVSNTIGNDAPIANNDTASTEVNTPVSSTVINNDSDPDGDTLTVTVANQGGVPLTVGTATIVKGVDSFGNPVTNAGTIKLNSDGTYTYAPATGFVGTVNPITYTISDGNGGTDTANLYINVTPNSGNQTFANDDANAAPRGITMNGNVLTNDTDPEGHPTTVTGATVTNVKGNAITPIVVTPGTATTIPGVGVLTIISNGTYTFVPEAGFVGTVVVPYTKCDNLSLPEKACDTATLYLTSLDITTCFNDPVRNGTGPATKVGITLLKRAGAGNTDNWPMVRKSGHLALESNTQGFVVTRMTTAELAAIKNAGKAVEGMMSYDTVAKCLKIYDGSDWKCFNNPSCP